MRYCQTCGADDIKAVEVDILGGESYQDVDLDQNPCIFPTCGHFLTIESMDGTMGIAEHYDTTELNGVSIPIAIKRSSAPFSVEDAKKCPSCRGSLRNLARYGRLVRRAILDESTKKVIVWINRAYLPLRNDLQQHMELVKSIEEKDPPRWLKEPKQIVLNNDRGTQVHSLGQVLGDYDPLAWKSIRGFRARLIQYRDRARVSEQPFARVKSAVDNVRRREGRDTTFQFDEMVLQMKGFLLASSLLLRLDLAILMTLLSLKQSPRTNTTAKEITLNLEPWKKDCAQLLAESTNTKRVPQQVEATIFLAQICAIQRSRAQNLDGREQHRLEGQTHLQHAQELCNANRGNTRGFQKEIDAVAKMLRESTFYAPITSEERMAVIQAMATEFHGSGHWYYCENGHPFTIGECGMPMERATCPECSAPVGGQQHQAVAGTRHADDLERGFRGLNLH